MSSNLQLLKQKGWEITSANNFSKFPVIEAENQGFVYALEYGVYIKIGKTRNLAERMKVLTSQAKKYSCINTGLVAYTVSHSNYSKNEKFLHSVFKHKRVENGELFSMNLDYFAMYLPDMFFKHDVPKDSNVALEALKETLIETFRVSRKVNTPYSFSVELIDVAKFVLETIGFKDKQLALALDKLCEKLTGFSTLKISKINLGEFILDREDLF